MLRRFQRGVVGLAEARPQLGGLELDLTCRSQRRQVAGSLHGEPQFRASA
jgi:hypothetical protein